MYQAAEGAEGAEGGGGCHSFPALIDWWCATVVCPRCQVCDPQHQPAPRRRPGLSAPGAVASPAPRPSTERPGPLLAPRRRRCGRGVCVGHRLGAARGGAGAARGRVRARIQRQRAGTPRLVQHGTRCVRLRQAGKLWAAQEGWRGRWTRSRSQPQRPRRQAWIGGAAWVSVGPGACVEPQHDSVQQR